jgi:hypothetical protein
MTLKTGRTMQIGKVLRTRTASRLSQPPPPPPSPIFWVDGTSEAAEMSLQMRHDACQEHARRPRKHWHQHPEVNYALNYPTPINFHQQQQNLQCISPSRQYPDLMRPQREYWQSLYVQPTLLSGLDSRNRRPPRLYRWVYPGFDFRR